MQHPIQQSSERGKQARAFRRAAASFNQGAAANHRPAWQSDGSDNLSATLAADRAFPAAVAELGRWAMRTTTSILALLLVPSAWCGQAEGRYYSDEEYKKLQGYAQPSSFYPDGNSGQLRLLIMCIDRGDVAVLDKLLNAAPNFANVVEGGSRCSPVHWATFKGDTNVLGVLVRHSADIKKKGTNWKITPLHIARDAKTAEFLLRHGADVESKEVHRQTPLMWAAKRGNPEVAAFLIAHGAKLDSTDERGRSALAFAKTWGHTNIVAMLVAKGATSSAEGNKESNIFEVTAGSFSGAGAEHPFAESTLIHGAPVERKK